VGSTSVPGLAAKPILDILLLVEDSSVEDTYAPALQATGYTFHLREPRWHEHRLFKAEEPKVNLHVFSAGSAEAFRMLAFRDWLRNHPDDRHLYEATKRQLAVRQWAHVQDYADAKSAVVDEILRRALAPPSSDTGARTVSVPWERLCGWIERFDARHPAVEWRLTESRVTASSGDGTRVAFDVPLGPLPSGSLDGLAAHLRHAWRVAIVLVRRGGFVVARLEGPETVEIKVGKRHVQSRTKAGGWSQQRFARRRSNQAQVAFDAATQYVEDLLLPHADDLDLLATGGDRRAVGTVLGNPRLSKLTDLRQLNLTVSGDPTRELLDRAVAEVRSVRIEITDPA
jgi:GrpB protein/Actinobacteria/chloroflexi VLRF1 release factor